MNKTYDIAHIFGNNMRILRNKKGISQLDLALQTGRTQTFINKIENGRKWVSPETLALICRELDAFPYQFFLTDDATDQGAGYAAQRQQTQMILDLREVISRYEKELHPGEPS